MTNLLVFVFQGLDMEWSNLVALVLHHTVMAELLPCTLVLPNLPATEDE